MRVPEITLLTPTEAQLSGFDEGEISGIRKQLTYVDKRVDFALSKTSAAVRRWEKPSVRAALVDKMGSATFEAKLAELRARRDALQAERKKCVLFQDVHGDYWTYSGLACRFGQEHDVTPVRAYDLPLPGHAVAWAKRPEYDLRPYQTEALAALLGAAARGPASVELPTGSGKSAVIRSLVKNLGLGAVVMAPSRSIARQLHKDFVEHFGPRLVGLYGDGKKEYRKLVVVAIDDSLALVEPETDAWAELSLKPVFIADEAHLTPANSLQKVCLGLMARAPYRFFVSATLRRTDGRDVVLEGIVGETVLRKTIPELVEDGYLAKPHFRMVQVRTLSNYRTPDANRMTKKHLYYNRLVNKVAGDLASRFVLDMRRPTLVLVKELEQFRELQRHLRVDARFAHGPLTKETRDLVPEAYRADDPGQLVDAFNAGKIPVLVGTSCISVGTDTKVPGAVLYLMGDMSEISVMQGAVGRSTRGGAKSFVNNPWTGEQKRDCIVVDFDVVTEVVRDPVTNEPYWDDSFIVHKHALARRKIYEEVGPVKIIDRTGVT